MPRSLRPTRRAGTHPASALPLLPIALAAFALAAAPLAARAEMTSLGLRQTPLAFSPEYGEIAAVPGSAQGVLLVGIGEGVELRLGASPGGSPVGRYRSTGPVTGVTGRADRAFLFHGPAGISWLDISDPAAPHLLATIALPHAVKSGAVLIDGTCAAASDSFVQFVRPAGGASLQLLDTISYSDGRRVARVRTSGDTLLIVASRAGALPRLYLTLYRLPASAAAPSFLHEWIFNGRQANDAAWDGTIAFVADGNFGIHAVNTSSGAFVHTTPLFASRFTRALDAGPNDLFAIGEAATLQRFVRYGALAESLQATAAEALEIEPVSVAVVGPRAVVATRDDVAPQEPDEVGRSQLEFPLSSGTVVPPIPAVRQVGRARRLVINSGLVYVADYSGGVRIYRAYDADTSLVGVLPPITGGRAVDLTFDAADTLLYVAAGADGLLIVSISNPAAPTLRGSLALPGLASCVSAVSPTTVAVGRRSLLTPGVTLVDVSTPTAPFARGSIEQPAILDPSGLAVRDTVLYVADEIRGLLSIGVGNVDAPNVLGIPSGAGARHLDLQGNLLLVSTRGRGLQVVDAFNPINLVLRSELLLPPMFGATRQGTTGVGALGDAGLAVVDLTQPTAATVRSIVASPGAPRHAAWSGDTLLIAAGTSIERFLLSPALPAAVGLTITLDAASSLPRAVVSWTASPSAGQIGWNVYRDRGVATDGTLAPGGVRVNATTLAPGVASVVDPNLASGMEHRYRLEAVYDDGRLLTVAEGSIFVPSAPRVGRAYPNPFRVSDGRVRLPYRTYSGGGDVILRVMDVRGRLVREITFAPPPPSGFGEAEWDGRGRDGRRVPSGVYYLHLRGPGFDDARAVVFIR